MNALIIHLLPMLLLGSLIKSTFLLLGAWAASCLLRRASAATRHLVWSLALGGILLVPILSLTLPQWKVAWGHVSASSTIKPIAELLPLPSTNAPTVSQAAPQFVPVSDESASLPAIAPFSQAVFLPTSGRQPLTFTCTLCIGLFVWLVGLLAVLCQLFAGLSRLARIERHSIPLEHREHQMAEDVRGRMSLRRPVRFLQATEASAIAVPVTWGVLCPVVLLPAQSSAWSEDCLRAALLHELAHVQRGDWATQITARLTCALYWWHPLVWWAARRAREESERACDDLVLSTGMKAADYAQRLVEVVRSMPLGAPARTVAVAMAQPSEVEERVKAVLATGKDRGHLSQRRMALILMMLCSLLLPLSALHPMLRAADADGQMNGDKMNGDQMIGHPIVVVDAGHGGIDTGGIGLNGVKEKDLNLSIAERLRADLQRRGAVVYMTRSDDTFSSIEDRTRFAAARHAAYFIGVHCDLRSSTPTKTPTGKQGTQVFFHGHNAKCHHLAEDISQQIGRISDLSPNRVSSDTTRFVEGFGVLRGASMPAVLVECGYLDNAHDLERLRDPQGQQRIANGIAQGLIRFQSQN